MERQIELSEAVSIVTLCRDADDNRILAASLDSKCSHLVTGDQDLRALIEFEGLRIVTPREFLELLPTG